MVTNHSKTVEATRCPLGWWDKEKTQEVIFRDCLSASGFCPQTPELWHQPGEGGGKEAEVPVNKNIS